MKNKNWPLMIVIALISLCLSGCEAFHLGDESSDTPTTTYSFGELTTTVVSPFDKTWQGVQKTLDDLHYTVKSSDRDMLTAKLIVNGGGKDITIHLEENSTTSTEIKIRVGKMGNKGLSQQLLQAIQHHI